MLEKKSEDFDHPKMTTQNDHPKQDFDHPKRHPKNLNTEHDGSLSHLTGDFAAPDSEPAGEKVYIALLEAKDRTIAARDEIIRVKDEIIRVKDEIIATKEAQIVDLRSFVDDMRKQTAVVQSNLDELREAIKEAQRVSKKTSVVHDAEDVVASRK